MDADTSFVVLKSNSINGNTGSNGAKITVGIIAVLMVMFFLLYMGLQNRKEKLQQIKENPNGCDELKYLPPLDYEDDLSSSDEDYYYQEYFDDNDPKYKYNPDDIKIKKGKGIKTMEINDDPVDISGMDLTYDPDDVIEATAEELSRKVVAANTGNCASGMSPNQFGLCYSVHRKNPVSINPNPEVRAAKTVLSYKGLTNEQINALIKHIHDYVQKQSREYNREEYLKNLYVDAFRNVLQGMSPGNKNHVENMRAINRGIAKTHSKSKKIKVESFRERMENMDDNNPSTYDSNNMELPVYADKSLQSKLKGLKKKSDLLMEEDIAYQFGKKGNQQQIRDLRGEAADEKELSMDAALYGSNNRIESSNLCEDDTIRNKNLFNNCYAELERDNIDAGVVSLDADTDVNRETVPAALCADNSRRYKNLFDMCYQPAYSVEEDPLYEANFQNQPMYGEGRFDGYNFCPNGEPVNEDGVCLNLPEEKTYDEYLKRVNNAGCDLVDALFPGSLKRKKYNFK